MDIGERCVITMLIMGLLLSRADNLGIEKVSYDTSNNGHKKCEGLLSAASAFLLTMYISIHYIGRILSLNMFAVQLPLPYIPVVMSDVICSGNETSLLQCLYNTSNYCGYNQDIILVCTGKRSIII